MKKQRTLNDTAALPRRSGHAGELDESERPTFRPPVRTRQLESEVRIRDTDEAQSLVAIRALLERFEAGDFIGALALADEVLDASRVPDLLVPRELLEAVPLEHRARALLGHVDGIEPLEVVLERSALPLVDAMQLLCELVERRIVTLR
jgi:hypothetical protein